MAIFLGLLLLVLPSSKVVAQCGYNNTFYINYTPVYDGAAHLANDCFFGGDLMTMTVVAGGTYTFSTCSTTAFDSEITVYDAAGATVLGFNDDACGANGLSSQLTVTAGYSGTMNVLIDQYNCATNSGPCMPMYITSSAPPPPPPPVGPPCPLTGSSAGNVTPGCGAFGGQLSIPSTAYASFTAITGVNYSVSTCASGWDSEISGYDAGNSFIGSGQTSPTAGGTFYNDDNGSVCATSRASLDWTSYFTGTVKVMVDRYACGSVWPGTSALLEVRQNTTISNATSTASMCGDGSTRTLAVNYAGTHTGSPAVNWSIVSGPGSISGVVYTASGVSGSSQVVTLGATLGACSFTTSFTVYGVPSTAVAGVAQTQCNNGTFTMAATPPAVGTGTWTVTSGSASITSPNAYNSTITGIAAGSSATLTWTVSTGGSCASSSSSVVLTNNQLATANAGSAQTICAGGTVTLAGSIGGSATSSTWSAGTGSFSNTASLTSTYTPSITSGTVTLTLTANGSPCGAVTSTVVITVNAAATANAGFAQTVCQGGSVTLAGSIGGSATSSTWSAPSGTFSLASSLTSTYTPSITSGNVTLTLTTNDPDGAGPCSAAISTVVITVNQAPTVSAGAAQTVCGGGTITLAGTRGGSATSSTWSAGTGSFSNTASLTSTYTPSISSGTVTLTLTSNDPDGAGPCSAAISTVTITVNQAATANAGFAQTVCEGGSVTLAGSIGGSATSSTWSAPSGTFSLASSLTSTYTPSITSGNVTLTLTTNDPDGAGPCSAAISTVVISVNQAPTVSAGAAQTVCGGGTITLAGTRGGSATSSTWSAGTGSFSNAASLTSTYTPSISSGTVTLTLTSNDPDGAGPCSAAISTVTITVNQAATANAGVPQTTCQGSTITLTGAIGGSATSSTWSAPSGTFSDVNSLGSTYTPSIASGNVTLTLTTNDPDGAGPCSGAVSTVVITVNQAATANAGSAQTVCQNGTITLVGSIGGSATSSTWSAPTGTFSNASSLTSTYSPSITSGTVTLTLTTNDPDGVGPCLAATSNVVITVTPLPAVNSVTPTAVLCFGGNTGTISVNASNGTPPLSYSIDNGATYQSSNFFNNLTVGSYNVVVRDVQTCSRAYALNPVVITQPTLLDHTTTVTDASCANVFDGKIDVFASGGVAPYAYSLNGGPTQVGSQFTGLQSGSYVVYVYDVNGCVDTSHVLINDSYNVSSFIVSQTDVSCFGGSNGAVTVQIVGGIPAYQYSINGTIFSASPIFTGLTAGNYVVILRDSKGCTAFQPVSITQPAQLSAIVDVVNSVSCNGTATGEIFISVNGGTAPYTYFWSNGDITQDVDSLLAGTYTATITDSKGCTAFTGATVSQPLQLFVNVASFHNLNCYNDSTGSIDVSVSGGVPAYTYVWSNGATTEDLTGLHAGTYTVTINDNNLCEKIITQTLTEPTQLTSSIVGSSVSCNGVSNGTVDLTPNGGTLPYTFQWSNATTNEDLTNVSAGTYSVIITDAHGCINTNTTSVSQPTGLGLTTLLTNVLCFGDATGAIDLTVTGGTPGYTYLWNDGDLNEDRTGLIAGGYSVVVTDNNSCSSSVTVTITQPAQALNGSFVATAVTCNGANNGSVNLTVTGGTLGYTFLWSTGATTEDLSGLAGGTYTVTITDAHGCTFTGSSTVTEPAVLSTTNEPTDVTCYGGNDGDIQLYVFGGNAPYTFLWSNFASTQNVTNLTAGTYTVIVTDSKGCQTITSITISQPTPIVITGTVTNVSCNGVNDGAIDITVSGGTTQQGYSYAWDNSSTSEDQSSLVAGTYSVTVFDDNGCNTTASFTVTQPAVLSVSAVTSNVNCSGNSNGFINITVAGGTGPFTYLWTNGATSEDLTGITGGTYDVTITDAHGCTVSASYTISEPNPIVSSIVGTDVTCHGAANGYADLTVIGGSTPYTFLWSTFQNGEDLANVGGGTYYVIITDANGCQKRDSIIIIEPAAITISLVTTNVLCNGDASGGVDITVNGGTPTITYDWSNSTSSEDLVNVVAGNYSVTITDGNGCTASATATVTQPAGLAINSTVTNVGCAGGANGSVDITIQGGVFPYTYGWSNLATTEDIHNVSGGNYSVTITDANGCSLTASFTVSEPVAMTASITPTPVSCFGGNDGAADLTVTDGTPPYTYLWSTFATTEDLTGLTAGNYVAIVTDANGCQKITTTTVTQPTQIVVSGIVTNLSCNSSSDGFIDVTVSGGTPGYTFAWSNSTSSEDQSNVVAGTYTVTVFDANLCTATATFTITEPAALTVSGTATDVTCNGGANGAINITVAGGTTPYSYSWSNGASTEDISGLSGGPYSVIVTDVNLCSASASFTISEPVAITSNIVATNVLCHGDSSGVADLTVNGGITPYTFLWNTFQNTEDLTNLSGGIYRVIITDANGCTHRDSIVITEPAAITISVVTASVLCNGDASGGVDITVNGGTPPINYTWSNGSTLEDLSGVAAGNYSVSIIDQNGCTASATATVTQPAALVLNSTTSNVACAGGANGSVDITVQGGVFPYSYAWSNGINTEDIHNVSGGNYFVTVLDANGCSLSASFTVSEPTALVATTTATDVSCHGANDGSVDLTVSGGVPAYTYFWTNGSVSEDLSGLAGGTYTVIVHDANGCSIVASQVVTEPTAIAPTVSVLNILCNGGTGLVDLTVTGGTPGYTFDWSNSTSSEDLVNVVAGTYTVTITDANGCTATVSATVTQPTALLVTGNSTDVSCNGGTNGTININVSGGVVPYTFAWSNGETTEDLSGLVAGVYNCVVTDGNGCTNGVSFTINQPTAITSSVAGTDVTCHGAANGSAILTVNGGTPSYTFAWSNFQVSQNLSNLSGGTYFVIITDANGCNHRDSVIIAEPSALVLSITTTNISCNGGTADVDLTVTGGTLNYGYAWDNGALTEDLTGVAAGTYTVTVTDGNGCTATATTTVIQPTALTLIGSATNVHCAGGNDGTVNISVGGGTTPYSYTWSNGSTSEDVQNLTQGTYDVTVNDLNGCTVTASYTITEPAGINTTITGTDVTCQGANNGTASLAVTGGTLPYTFFWSNFQGSQNIANLDGGIYYVLITDANGCTHRDSVIIGEPSPIIITVDSAFDITCFANQDGAIYISVNGGTPGYSYLWSNDSTSQDVNGLIDAIYVVTVTDANGCTAAKSINIARPSLLSVNAIINTPLCFMDLNGSIDLIPSGGTPSYTYEWKDSAGAVIFTTEDISGIGAGRYTVIITDVRGCTAYDSLTVTEPGPFYITTFFKNPTCHDFTDGYLDITGYGGTLPYDFVWSNNVTSEDQFNLPGGTYSITATDAHGCAAQDTRTLTNPPAIIVNATATPVSCFGGNDGTLTGTATGGIPVDPLHFLWSTFDTSSTVLNVIAGHYVLQVTDSFGCYNSDTADVVQPTDIDITGNITNAVCFGTTGGVDITVTGGTPTYTFVWTGGSTNEDLTNALAGTDTVTVTDSKGCVKSTVYTITQPTEIYLSLLSNQPSCNGSTNGSLSVVATQGIPGYSYAWNTVPAQNTASAANLTAGDYTVTVTDSKGCSATATQTLNQPSAIDVSTDVTASSCSNVNDGVVVVTATGGLAPYIYELNGLSQLGDTFTQVSAGNYLVVISDANGCDGTDTFTITQTPGFALTLTTNQQTILTGMQTQLNTNVLPAQTIVSIAWSPLVDSAYGDIFDFGGCDPNNCPSPNVHPHYTTTFMAVITNTDGCSAYDTITIDVKNEASKFIPSAFTPNGDGLNDRFEFDILGADKLDVSIYSRWGDLVFHNDNQVNGMNQNSGWDGTKGGKLCPFDTYVYKIKITYFDKSVVDITGTVTLMN